MGMFKLFSSTMSPNNPNPSNFHLESSSKIGDVWVSVIVYPNCTNHEGRKVLVTRSSLRGRIIVDPHFTVDNNLGLIARFEPTKEGIQLAVRFAETIKDF